MAAHTIDKYRVNWTTPDRATNAARLASLADEGPLNVPVAGWLGTACTFLSAGTGAGARCVTLKQIDFMTLEGYTFSAALRAEMVTFVLHPHRTARLLQAIDLRGGGLPDDARFEDVQAARADLVPRIKALPAADRELDTPDVLTQPGPAIDTWLQRLTVGKLLAVEVTGSILLQVRGLIFGQNAPDDGPYQVLVEMMGPESSFTRSITMRAAQVPRFMQATAPPAAYLTCVTLEGLDGELARRLLPTASERFAPLFYESWRTACKNLAKLLTKPCTGEEAYESAVELMLVAKLPAPLLPESAALLDTMVGSVLATIDLDPAVKNGW